MPFINRLIYVLIWFIQGIVVIYGYTVSTKDIG